jgi:hypothetical protein
MSRLTAIANTHTHTPAHKTHTRAEGEKSGEREGNSGETMAMPSDGEIDGPKGMAGCVLCVGGGAGGGKTPLCKREQLSPPFQFSKAPEHCGTTSRTLCGTYPLVEPYVGISLGPPVGPIPL